MTICPTCDQPAEPGAMECGACGEALDVEGLTAAQDRRPKHTRAPREPRGGNTFDIRVGTISGPVQFGDNNHQHNHWQDAETDEQPE